jgi:hypothetical protein
MAFNATVSAGWTYKTGDTVTAANLNALGLPSVSVPDDQTYLINVGSVSAPGIAFNGNANTGLAQLAGVDTASMVAGGNEVVRFIGNRQTGFSDGTDSAPSITFIGDGDTGINHDTAGQIDFVCDKTVVGQFNTSGLIVVGNVEADSVTVNGTNVLTAGISTSVAFWSTDFLEGIALSGFSATVASNGAVTNGTISTPKQVTGIVSVGLGVTASGSAIFCKDTPIAAGHRCTFRFSQFSASPLSNGTNRYYVIFGVSSVGSSEEVNGASSGTAAWFQYYDLDSAQWQTKTKTTTNIETTTTATTVAGWSSDKRFDIVNNGTDTKFYIDNVLVATHVTRVVTPGALVFPFVRITATAGTPNAQGLVLDSFEMQYTVSRI